MLTLVCFALQYNIAMVNAQSPDPSNTEWKKVISKKHQSLLQSNPSDEAPEEKQDTDPNLREENIDSEDQGRNENQSEADLDRKSTDNDPQRTQADDSALERQRDAKTARLMDDSRQQQDDDQFNQNDDQFNVDDEERDSRSDDDSEYEQDAYDEGLKSLLSRTHRNQVSNCGLPNFSKRKRRQGIENSFEQFQGDLPGSKQISLTQGNISSRFTLEKYQVYRDCLDSQFLSKLFQRKSEFLTKKLELKKDEYTINILHTSIKKSEEQIVTYRGQKNNSEELRKNLQKQLNDLQDQKESQLSTNLYGPFIIFGSARCSKYKENLYNEIENRLEQKLPAPELIFANTSQSKNVKKYFIYPVGARVEDTFRSKGKLDYFIFRPAILRPDMSKGENRESTGTSKVSSRLKQCESICNFSIDYDEFLSKYHGRDLLGLIKAKLKGCRLKRTEKRAFMASVNKSIAFFSSSGMPAPTIFI